MNGRLNLAEIARRLADTSPAVLVGAAYGTAYDRDYVHAFAKTYPAAWVLAQRGRAVSGISEDGSAGWIEQPLTVEFVVRLVLQRYADGVIDAAAKLDEFIDGVIGALVGWMPSNATRPIGIATVQDGPAHESLMIADLVFRTEVIYERNTP